MLEVILQVGLVPVVAGVVQVFKTAGLPSRVAPLISLLVGIGAAIGLLQLDLAQEVLQGVVIGLAASGLYSGLKAQTTGSTL